MITTVPEPGADHDALHADLRGALGRAADAVPLG
jgi:hypothetical protein